MNIYRVTKRTLILIWIIVIGMWSVGFVLNYKLGLKFSENFGLLSNFGYPLILISYTFGWKRWKNTQLDESNKSQIAKFSLLSLTLPLLLMVLFDWLVLKIPLGEVTGFGF